MRLLIYILTSIPITLLVAFTTLTNPISIQGHLVSNDNSERISKVKILVKTDNKIVKTTMTNSYGYFRLKLNPEKSNSFDLYYVDPDFTRDTLFLKSYTNFEISILTDSFSIPTQYIKDEVGNIKCPKCQRTDNVFHIVYGEGIIKRAIVNSDTMWTNIFEEEKIYYASTCIKGLLNYYCTRDKIKF